jgi:N-acetyl-gamma-glutamyl-phosphate reductase
MTEVAIIGANGYSGEELCAILAQHPQARITALTSRQHAGKPLASVLPRLAGLPSLADLKFADSQISSVLASHAEYVFLALPHGLASEFAIPLLEAGKRIIDLSADFRLQDPAIYEEFYGGKHPAPGLLADAVYGLPELHRAAIADARLVASAGCYPTSILIPLVPLLKAGLIKPASIIASCASGTSGAGRKATESLLHAECNEALHAYSLPKHRHLSEIEQELSLAAGESTRITFVPHLAPMTRGLHATIFVAPSDDKHQADIEACWRAVYENEPFVRLSSTLPDVKNVTATNFCDIAVREDTRTGRMVILSAEDNLGKGAAGQAVQNFNLMAGFPETDGLL